MPLTLEERVTGVWNQGDTKTLTLATTPPSGRLLVVRFVSDVVQPLPTGWIRSGSYPGGNTDVGLFCRLADGSVNSFTFLGNGDTVGVLEHYSGNISTSINDCVDRQAQVNNSASSGTTATTAQDDELALAAMGAGSNESGTWSGWTNSFTEDADLQSPGGLGTEITGGFASRALTATGQYSTSATNSAPNSGRSGCIVTFKAAAAGSPQVTTSIPLSVSVTAEAETQHAVTAAIPLGLGVNSQAATEHQITAGVPLDLTVTATSQAPAISGAEVTTSIPLSVEVGAESRAAHEASAAIPLTVDVAGISDAPAVGAAEVTAQIPLTVAIGSSAATDRQITAAIPLGLTLTGTSGTPAFPPPLVMGAVTGPAHQTTAISGPADRRIVTGAAIEQSVTGAAVRIESVDGPLSDPPQIDGPELSRDVTGPDTRRVLTGPGV